MAQTIDVVVTTMADEILHFRLDLNSQHYVQMETRNWLSWAKKAGDIKGYEFVESPRILSNDEIFKALEPVIEIEKKKRAPKAKLKVGAWVVDWTESESGWGQRPDGCCYFADEETAKRETQDTVNRYRAYEATEFKKTGMAPDCYSFPDTPVFVQVSAELGAEIEKNGKAYRDRRES